MESIRLLGRVPVTALPELPEVEVTRRELAALLLHRTVSRATVVHGSRIFLTAPVRLERCLRNRNFVSLSRIGKHLVAGLDNGARLLFHLGMTGRLFAIDRTVDAETHVHLTLRFQDGGRSVAFKDPRKFGRIELLEPGAVSDRLSSLGPDALYVDGAQLHRIARKRRSPVKCVLLDQSAIAGIGNIYADEALFLARIRPTLRAYRLTRSDCMRLAASIRRVLRRAIKTGGSTISDFVRPSGNPGFYQDERWAYGRTGEPCRRCDHPIRRIVLSQRSTHFCPRCQRSGGLTRRTRGG